MSIVRQINEILMRENRPVSPPDVLIECQDDSLAGINTVLQKADNEERFQLLKDLFLVWTRGLFDSNPSGSKLAKRVFGKIFTKNRCKQIMLTLNCRGCRLCLWYDIPVSISALRVNSFKGNGLLFEISGTEETVKKYLDALVGEYTLREIEIPNGVKLYMRWA